MKRSTKITSVIILFFIIIATVIGGRYAMKIHFQKKFGKRPDPGVIVVMVKNKNFSQKIEALLLLLMGLLEKEIFLMI